MSDDQPPRLAGRPRLAEALANLKHGLRDSADPFFDGWRPPRSRAQAADNVAKVVETQPATADTIEQRVFEDALPTEFAERTHFQHRAAGAALAGDALPAHAPPSDELPAHAPPSDELHAPTLEMDKVRIAVPSDERSPLPTRDAAGAERALRDTVRVRVVPYRRFPKWALVLAAALLAFAASVVALRATYPSNLAPVGVLAAAGGSAAPIALTKPELTPPVDSAELSDAVPGPIDAVATPLVTDRDRDRVRAAPRNAKPRQQASHPAEFFREPGF